MVFWYECCAHNLVCLYSVWDGTYSVCIQCKMIYYAYIQCGGTNILSVGWYTLPVFKIGGYIFCVLSIGWYTLPVFSVGGYIFCLYYV